LAKSLIEQINENAQFTARCPSCQRSPGFDDRPRNQMGPGNNGLHKRGRHEGAKRSSMPACDLCKGTGLVFLNRICECGSAAVLLDTKLKVWSCGHKTCTEQANRRLNLGGSVTQFFPGGWHEYGG
jgi:hypothetical protein